MQTSGMEQLYHIFTHFCAQESPWIARASPPNRQPIRRNFRRKFGHILPRDFQTIVMYFNKARFDTAGIAYPDDSWTIGDFKAAAALTRDTDGDGKLGQWGVSTEIWDMEPFWGPMVCNHGG